MEFENDFSLKEWAKDKPLSILQLDPADRAVLRIADERDAIQKKTFTKWVNKHLKKVNRHVTDLFEDLRDGLNLISLLEVLSGEHLPREKGRMRFHMLQNVQMALDFLRYKKIKLVNIRAEDIVDGNPKLTLGLIWTIILHFQISDIVVGQEPNVTAREALLSWARRSTAKYPGVRVADFTSSWRDGLAFNALIHRNRPDLIDWRNIRSRHVRERLETAFHVVEKEYGVTRLLDPEDVDTHEPDEKSLITYISSLYETFPEPPAVHPLFDAESQRRAQHYTELAAQHRAWLHENTALMQDRAFPSTLIEMKKLLSESTRFRNDEVPLRQREKQKLISQYRDLEKYFESVGECDIEPTLRPEALEQAWARLLMAQQERERDLTDQIRRLERLQRLAEKLHRDIKQTESGLDNVERHIESEIRRMERGVHPADAKMAAEQIEQELRTMEAVIQEMLQDAHTLREGRYPHATELTRRVQQVHDRWLNARQAFTGRLVPRLSSVRMPVQQTTVRRETRTVLETRVHDADPKFQQLQEAVRWCKEKLKKLHESEYGSDIQTVQQELDKHQREHKTIDQFHSKVEQCVHNRANFSGEDLHLYNQHLSQLQKLYAELLSTSTKRMSDLDALQDFLQSATAELNWLNEKEQVEVSRDWADPHINLPAVQHYYEQLMSSLEKRELQFSNVIDRGEALIAQHHPATKTIEAHLQVMQSQWAWVLQLTLCLETHLKHTTQYHNFFEEVKESEKWIQKREESLNTTFSQSEFTLDQGERLLKGMQELREELNGHGATVSKLVEEAQEIRPVKQRRQPVTRPLRAETVCAYKNSNVAVEKGSAVTVVDNSGRSRWRVRLGGAGTEVQLPGAVVALPPPCQEALDAASRLRNAYDRVIQLWQRKQLRMRQNMIFATIKVVKGWDFPQFVAMGAEQRQAIRRALNDDAEKLLAEGDPADPQLRRLRREIDDVNRLFDEFERRARAEEESKNAARIFTEQSSNLLERLEVLERQLHERIASHIPRDLDSLEHLVLQHKDWQSSLHALSRDVDEVQATFRGIALKTPAMKKNLDKLMGKWNDTHSKSQLFVERLKFVEIVVNSMEENNQTISEFEIKLAQFSDLPDDVELLKDMHEDLLRMQVAVTKQQIQIDQMNDDAENCRRLVESSRAALPHSSLPRSGKHVDLERLDKEVTQLNNRWNSVCTQLAERLRSCEAAYQLLRNYNAGLEKEVEWIDDSFNKLQAAPPIEIRPKEQFEPTRNLLNNVVERTPKIEKVNVDGGRFIREAKIYSSRCQRYAEWLCDEIHPSLEMKQLKRQAEVDMAERLRNRKRTVDPDRVPSGAEAVARELDELNAKHQRLLDLLYERLRRIAAANPGDIVTLRLVEAMAPRSVRSFRQEFNMHDLATTTEHSYTTHYTTEQYVRTTQSTELDGHAPVKSITNGKLGSPNTTKTYLTEDDRPDIRNLKRVHKMYEGPNIIESKGIIHPETKEVLTVGQAISMRILDVRTGRLLSSPETRQTMTIDQAAKEGLIDPKLASRLTGACGMTEDGNEVTLLEAIQRELYDAELGLADPAEKRIKQAVEEKYRLCDETLSKLLEWIAGVEDKLANQEAVKEDIDELRNQINILKLIKDDLESHQRQVSACADQAKQLLVSGGDVLAPHEVAALERGVRQLKQRCDKCTDKCDKMLRRLAAARDELGKFTNELNAFNSWMESAYRTLEEKEAAVSKLKNLSGQSEDVREFVSDVIAHQADLRFITMAAQKFVDESKEFLTILNEYRTSLPSRLSHIHPAPDSAVREGAALARRRHADLAARAQRLQERLRGAADVTKQYQDALDRASRWMNDIEPQVRSVLSEPVGGEPRAVESQLSKAKTLHNEILSQGRLIDNAKDACNQLVKSLEGNLTPAEIRQLEVPVVELTRRYGDISGALGERCAQLEGALLQCQGLQDAAETQAAWLNQAEGALKNQLKPASLIRERLDEQVREHRISHAEVEARRPTLSKLVSSAREAALRPSNARIAKKLEQRAEDIFSRYEKLLERSLKRAQFLDEVSAELAMFTQQAQRLESAHNQLIEQADSRDLARMAAEELTSRLSDLAHFRDNQMPLLEECLRNGKLLISKKDVTDTHVVRDRMKALENLWRDFNTSLEEKQKLSKQRADQLNQYESLRQQVMEWLKSMDSRVGRLQPVAVDLDVIKQQQEELRPLTKEYRDYSVTIDRVNEAGAIYESLTRGERADSPHRKRYSPTKRQTPIRQLDGRSPSPTKGHGLVSPGSTHSTSSGFSSRRSSQDGFHLDELSPVQQQLSEINNRYGLLGTKLSDRQSELDSLREEVKRHLDSLRTLNTFLDKVQRQLPKDAIPSTKDEADKTIKQARGVLEEMYEKQSTLDSTKTQVRELLKRKQAAPGADRLNSDMEDVASRWKNLHDHCKDKIRLMEEMKDLHDTHSNLSQWLGAKERMMAALGPISSDSRLVQTQVQQVQVLREEFRTQQPQLTHLEEVAAGVLDRLDPRSPDAGSIRQKVKEVQDRWNDLLGKLEQRAESLGAAADTSREFDAGLARLRDALQTISDKLDDLAMEKEPEDQLRKIENLERQLEGQRPLLADLESRGAALSSVLSDPASRQDIQSKLAAVARQYDNLQRKLDHRKAEIEAALKDGRNLEETVARTLGWLQSSLGSLPGKLQVSADRHRLAQQIEKHEPLYREVAAREHELIMLLDKGREMEKKPAHQGLRKELDRIQNQWDKLKREAFDRHTRLQAAMEHCRKYHKAQESFVPWLSDTEERLAKLPAAVFTKKEVEKQLKDLQHIRNDIWKKSGEYENNKTLGETFISACDVDQEVVRQQLDDMKNRWDRINNEVLQQVEFLESTARKLGDFAEKVRAVETPLERCEERLEDALRSPPGAAAAEAVARLADQIHALKAPLQSIHTAADDIVTLALECAGPDAASRARQVLEEQAQALGDRLHDLEARAGDAKLKLLGAAAAITQFNDKVKSVSNDLSELEKELDGMKPPGRELKVVKQQLDDVARFYKKLERADDLIADTATAAETLLDTRYGDSTKTRDQVEGLRKKLSKLDERARAKEQELDDTLSKLEAFYKAYDSVMDDVQDASEHVRSLKPVSSEVDQIRTQQKDFAELKRRTLEPLGLNVASCNKIGQGLVRSALQGVSTAQLEKDLEKMNDKWNTLKEKMNERERRLDVGLLQSGKFAEALAGLEKWLADTEDMVNNQKPPSADYKVVKAQLQEQKFLKKMLMDRQNSMSSLFAMGNEVAGGCEPSEKKAIEKQLKGLMQRFDALTDGAQQRMLDLEQAMKVAKQFEEQLQPLVEWLGNTERKVKQLELVPTDEEKIQQKIREHKNLHDDILSKQPPFKQLTETASTLMGLVGDDEAVALADRLQAATDRYQALVEHSLNVGDLLDNSRKGLRHLVLTYQELAAWMDGMEAYLNKRKILPVNMEKLLRQMDELAEKTEEIAAKQELVDSTVESGLELMKHISGDEALQLKEKLDALQRRYNELTSRGAELLRVANQTLPLVQHFYTSHGKLTEWMNAAESVLQSVEPREDDILRLEADLQEFKPVLDNINLIGPQLCQISPGEGATHIEGIMTRDNRRFDAIAEQVQRKAERLLLSKKRSLEVVGDMEDLLEWLRGVETQLRSAEPPSCEPKLVRTQLNEHRPLNDDVAAQRGRVRDLLAQAKKVLRECHSSEETAAIRDRSEELRDMMEEVGQLSADRLSALEQALPLAEHFADTHHDLSSWLDDMEKQIQLLAMPALRPEQIVQQQDKNEMLQQSISGHKPLVDKLVKTGEALARLCGDDDANRVQDIVEGDCERYNALRAQLRQRQQELEQALQDSSQFADKLEGMLRALANTADQVANAEPVSAHPPKIEDQIEENNALVEDLEKRTEAYNAVQRAASDVISKANKSDPAVRDIRNKLDKLNKLWDEVQRATNDRGQSLDSALETARKFWEQLNAVMATLAELADTLNAQPPPAAQPRAIQAQQVALQEIRHEIDHTKPEVEKVRKTGSALMSLCGEPDKPEVKKHMEDLDSAWDNITALYARREENLIDAMEKAMEFHDTLQNLQEFLDKAEDKFSRMGPLGSDIDAVKRQISQLASFKQEVDPHMVKVEALNRQAQELTERTSSEQAQAIKQPLKEVNARWSALLRGMVERQQQLEKALLRLGQLQHALQELLSWIQNTSQTLDTLQPVAGDPQILEVELAKLKVLVNDIAAHQASVDTLNDAGSQIVQQGTGTDEASETAEKLATLNRKWRELQQKARDKQTELEDALREAQSFNAEIIDLLSWLTEVDGVIAASKPVGGLPETASEQLERFMEVYNEIEANRPKVEAVLQQGQEYIKKQHKPNPSSQLHHNLKNLKSKWDNVTARASDKKIKLEIALKEATEFHDALQAFVDWLTGAEKTLTNAKPVSRVMETLLTQIEEHKSFQKEVSTHRETMLHLDKKGTHLKYFSQKQDVILIKNLLVSVQHRWERVVSKAAERTRALDHGFKEAKEFSDMWNNMMNWLSDTEQQLDELNSETTVNDPEKIKQRLSKHREFQKALAAKQPVYDQTTKVGKQLKDKAPKTDEPTLRTMLQDLKTKWTTVCSKAVDRQRRLEEALLYSGQFKDAMSALLDWLRKQQKALAADSPVHGDLDTVMALIEQHKQFEEDLHSREQQMQSVLKTGKDLEATVPREDATVIRQQCSELRQAWDSVQNLSEKKAHRLEGALKEAEKLHKSVNMLLEWLSDAETKLRFSGQLPEGDMETQQQIRDHEKFIRELKEKQRDKDDTISLAHAILGKAHPDAVTVIKHWITIIQSRWDEVWQWAMQRGSKLDAHMQSLKDLDTVLEELLQWLSGLENTLISMESEPLPESIELLEGLIEDHKELMEHTQKRQTEVDRVCKAYQVKSQSVGREGTPRKVSAKTATKGTPARGSQHDLNRERSVSPDYYGTRRYSRISPGRETPDRMLPHYGPRFPARGSKGAEPEFRSPRVKQLWDKWRNVWFLAWERQRRLHERLAHLKELQRVSNFSWDDWRKRFLKFMNHKKSRLTDLFRKMDKDNNGMIPRNEFIDGIINTKFDTSRLEMGAVADLFDRNGLGLIDWEEFIAALRPDWVERRGPPTDADKIHDEVKRLVMLCTCRQKFRVFQVGEGKYRFGDSQKLRLVRILRSTVMVRVGGGWVALDEFLVKNDPCRAKGRTNIELREQFILADGVSQSMAAFRPRTPRSNTNTPPSTGPIMKVRERTARSVPMSAGGTAGRASRSSLSAGTPDSLSDNEAASGLGTRYRKPSAPRSTLTPGGSRPGSRPGSRAGSKPPSRHGSNLSLDSTDDVGTPSRIPMRKVTNTRASLARANATATKLGATTPNGGSRPRTPTGFLTPASGRYPMGSMYRTSSIPTLSPVPALVRQRTPSGSTTPVRPGQQTAVSRLLRKPSDASDTGTPTTPARRGTPKSTTEKREPFRL